MQNNYCLSDSERERSRLIIYLYYIYKGCGRLVLRQGWNLWGVTDRLYPPYCEPNRPEYVIEHEPSCVFLAFLLFELFPEYFYGIDRSRVYELLLAHDLSETVISDIPDDKSRDEEKKNIEELAFFEWLFERKADFENKGTFKPLVANFEKFQRKSSILARFAYCIDKTDALFQGLVYEYEGFPGSPDAKRTRGKLSKYDEEIIELTGSSSLVDNWFESCRPNIEHSDPTGIKFFTLFTEAAISYVRSDEFHPREDLVQYCEERDLPIPLFLKSPQR